MVQIYKQATKTSQ